LFWGRTQLRRLLHRDQQAALKAAAADLGDEFEVAARPA
jgi:hypothetical protein